MNWFFLLLIFIHRIMIYVYVKPPPPSHSSSFCSSFQTNARAQEMHMDDESILQKAMYSSSTVRLSLPLHRIDEEILCFSLLKASLMEYADTYTHTHTFSYQIKLGWRVSTQSRWWTFYLFFLLLVVVCNWIWDWSIKFNWSLHQVFVIFVLCHKSLTNCFLR